MEKEKAICILSGGMDSATALALAINQGYDVSCLNFTSSSPGAYFPVMDRWAGICFFPPRSEVSRSALEMGV